MLEVTKGLIVMFGELLTTHCSIILTMLWKHIFKAMQALTPCVLTQLPFQLLLPTLPSDYSWYWCTSLERLEAD